MRKLLADQSHESRPENIRQSFYRNKIIFTGFQPVLPIRGKSSRRDQTMHMGMIDQCPCPGMEDCQHADLSAHIAGICRQLHQGQGCRLHKNGITCLLVRPDDFMEFFRQSKDSMKVRHRQALLLPFFLPDFSIRFVTGGTTPVFAGMISIA